jgi:hypothetical protein
MGLNKKNIILLTLLIILLISSIIVILIMNSNNSSLEQANNLLQTQLIQETQEHEQTKLQLQSELTGLSQTNTELTENLTNLDISYAELNESHTFLEERFEGLKTEVNDVIIKIQDYEDELQDSMQWFNDNSKLDILDSDYAIKKYLETKCIMKSHGRCRIKTGCLFLINTEKMDLEYKYDIQTSNEVDQLQSLNEFVDNGGGDCEDFSLFYKAEFNYLLEYCEDIDESDIFLEAWVSADDIYDKYALDFNRNWFILGGEEIDLPKNYIYPNIICGLLPTSSGSVSGHCVIAFTEQKITSTDNLDLLDKAPIIEPQTGHYMGLINDESSYIYLLTNSYYNEVKNTYSNPYIYEVITDDDLFLFSFEEEDWLSYSGFYEELSDKEQELRSII